MTNPSKSQIKRIILAIRKMKRKYVSLEMLAANMGIYPDVLSDDLETFIPLLRIDTTVNLMSYMDAFEEYVKPTPTPEMNAGETKPKRVVASMKEVDEYKSVTDFVYRNMTTAGGLMDPSLKLGEKELKILQKIVARDLSVYKKKSNKGKGRDKKSRRV